MTHPNAPPSVRWRWLIRLGLLAFSPEFRDRFSGEMLAAHEDRSVAGKPATVLRSLWTFQDLVRNGLAERWARRGVRRAPVQPPHRGTAVRDLLSDFAHAVRTLFRHPRFTFAAVTTLALGIGGITVMFSLVNGILLDPLPYPGADRLVRVYDTFEARGQLTGTSSPANFLDWREQQRGIQLAAWNTGTITFTGVEPAEPVSGAYVTAEFFDVMGRPPVVGRSFRREEETWGNHKVVILGYEFWQRHFSGDAGILGRTISLEGEQVQVVGVAPKGFAYPSEMTELYQPLAYDFDVSTSRGVHYIGVLGRLEDGTSLSAAEALIQGTQARLAQAYPERLEGWGVRLMPLQEAIVGASGRRLQLMLGAVGLVFLIAIVNVVNLMMARAVSRRREMALRVAIGAGRWHLSRQLIAEGLVVTLAAAVVGLGIAWATLQVILPAAVGNLPRLGNVAVDGMAFLFVLAVAIPTGVVLGLVPAFMGSRSDVQRALTEGVRASDGRSAGRLRSGFVVAQVALAVILAVGAGLLMRSYGELVSVDPGYGARRALVATVGVSGSRYPEPADRSAFFLDLVHRLDAMPGVRAAATTTQLPLEGYSINFSYRVETNLDLPPNERPSGDFRVVSPGYFRTLGIPLLRGREFTEGDTRDRVPVVVIDQALAEQSFGTKNPVGERLYISYGGDAPREIIGVVGDVRQRTLDAPAQPGYYLPVTQESWSTMRVVLVTDQDPVALTEPLRRVVAEMDPLLSVRNVRTLEEWFTGSVRSPRLNTLLLGLFAAIAVLLSVAGIYSVISYVVTRRTHEIAVRMALGARQAAVRRTVVWQSFRLAVLGVGVGLIGARLLTRFLASLLYGVSPSDPWSFTLAALAFVAVAVVGGYLPARRASSVDPVAALQTE